MLVNSNTLLQNALKETINKLQGKMTGKDFSKSEYIEASLISQIRERK